MLLVETSLDNGGTGEQSFLEGSECLVLDLDGGFFLEGRARCETALLEDWKKRIVNLLLSTIVLVLLLTLLHLVSGLGIDGLLQDS